MAKQLLHLVKADAIIDQQAGIGMTQVMDAHLGEARRIAGFEIGDVEPVVTGAGARVDEDVVISPFLRGCIGRIHAAIFSFMAGVMPPIPMFGRSLLYVQSHCVA
jgi:hypothetical protein